MQAPNRAFSKFRSLPADLDGEHVEPHDRPTSPCDAVGHKRLGPIIGGGSGAEGLVEVSDDVVGVLDADRQPDGVVGRAGCPASFGVELTVGG